MVFRSVFVQYRARYMYKQTQLAFIETNRNTLSALSSSKDVIDQMKLNAKRGNYVAFNLLFGVGCIASAILLPDCD